MAFPVLAVEPPNEQERQNTFIHEVFIPTKTTPERSKMPQVECNCVMWAKMYLGRENESWGYPKDVFDFDPEPRIGGTAITSEGLLGHRVVILDIVGNTIFVIEANYKPCEVTTRAINRYSPIIRGFKN